MKQEDIIQAISGKLREMSTETVMFHQAVADELGLHITDHKCLDLVYRFGPMPAGRLAELTGLTTGAVTGVVDRLEKAGYAKRVDDPDDRRRIIIAPTRNKRLEKKLETIFNPLAERMNKLLSSYSEKELAFLLDVLTKSLDQSHQELIKLRGLRD
jgi:DNA-binding MarR family transcriptional regulator